MMRRTITVQELVLGVNYAFYGADRGLIGRTAKFTCVQRCAEGAIPNCEQALPGSGSHRILTGTG